MSKEYTAEETAANRKKWTDALRSGKYRQGDSYLHQGDKFCCLGVACDVAIKNGLELPVEPSGDIDDVTTYNGADTILPDRVQRWLGLEDPVGTLRKDFGHDGFVISNLWHMNDRARSSFEEIAKVIDEDGVTLAGEEAITGSQPALPTDEAV